MLARRSGWLFRYGMCAAVAWVALRLLGPAWPTSFEFEFPDSVSYTDVAARSPFSWHFWFADRPPTYPLLLWLVGRSSLAVVVVQTALAFAAWLWLMTVVLSRTRRKWLSVPAVLMLVVVATQGRWIFWDTLVLSESLSMTLAVAMVAGWLQWWAHPTRARTAVLSGVIVAWMCLRDSNALSWLAIAAPALIVAIILVRRSSTQRHRALVVILGLSVLAGGYSIVGQIASNRGEAPFANNVGLRWLPNSDMTDFMVARGMPLDEALLSRTGKDAWSDSEEFLVSPDLAAYREWAAGPGRSAAVASFVLKAPFYVRQFNLEVGAYSTPGYLFAYDYYGVTDRFPERGLGRLDPVGSLRLMWVWGVSALVSIALLVRVRRALALVLAMLLASVLVDCYLSFCGDAIEVGRHLVGPWNRYTVLCIVVVVIGADGWLTDRAIAKQPAMDASSVASVDPSRDPSPVQPQARSLEMSGPDQMASVVEAPDAIG